MSSVSLVLCQPSDGHESDWSNLYMSAFPQDERMSLADLQAMITNKTMLLHRTTDASGALLCFSLVNPMSNFSLLAYIATDQTKRSSGVGSKHMAELLKILKNNYQSSHIGLFLEIEATNEPSITAAEVKERTRRLAFYQKLGCKRLCGKNYFMPSYSTNVAVRHGELLWFEYGSPVQDDATISGVIAEIYTRAYAIDPTHIAYVQVLSQFASQPQGSYDAGCAVTAAVAPAAGAPPAVTPSLPVTTASPAVSPGSVSASSADPGSGGKQ